MSTSQATTPPESLGSPLGYASLRGRLLRKWDWWIYCRAVSSLRRMTLDNPGMSYLMELNLRGWNEQLSISPELKRSTQLFHESMREPSGRSGVGSKFRQNVQAEPQAPQSNL